MSFKLKLKQYNNRSDTSRSVLGKLWGCLSGGKSEAELEGALKSFFYGKSQMAKTQPFNSNSNKEWAETSHVLQILVWESFHLVSGDHITKMIWLRQGQNLCVYLQFFVYPFNPHLYPLSTSSPLLSSPLSSFKLI